MIKRLRAFFETVPLHPFLLVLNVCGVLFVSNQPRLELHETISTVLTLVMIVVLIIALLTPVLGGLRKAAVGATLIVFYLLFFPVIVQSALGDSVPQIASVIVGAALVLGILWVIRPSKSDYRPVTLILNFALCVAPLTSIKAVIDYQTGPAQKRVSPQELFPDVTGLTMGDGRDIWHLVFDRYGDAETLKRVYGYDNEPFLKALEARGFFIARNAVANYQRTAHSLASVFNMEYLDPLTGAMGDESSDWVPVYRNLSDNRVSRFFGASDYKFIHMGSWWNPTRRNPYASENRNLRDLPEFGRALLDLSAIGRVAAALNIGPAHGRGDQCARIKFKFDELRKLADDPDKTFVTAHILVPHPPYVVDADGNCLDLERAASRSRVENYLGQLEYANRSILTLVDRILESAKTPPIIILQADEGPWPARMAGDESLIGRDAPATAWLKASDDELREKMRVLNALYLPGGGADGLPDHLSPVNTFRLIFDRYFGGTFGLLEDRSFIYDSERRLYSFTDVTERVR
ncbi:hypothetical protein GWP57_08225 [Gammaproteobacteria bacterium]|jgi:hypothetical protein|nr:hypothetical protein [Gammaproteobacteria bacterium]